MVQQPSLTVAGAVVGAVTGAVAGAVAVTTLP